MNIYEKIYHQYSMNNMSKIQESKDNFKVYCDCGVSAILTNADRKICYSCGNYIYKDDKTKFRYKMMEKIRKVKNE